MFILTNPSPHNLRLHFVSFKLINKKVKLSRRPKTLVFIVIVSKLPFLTNLTFLIHFYRTFFHYLNQTEVSIVKCHGLDVIWRCFSTYFGLWFSLHCHCYFIDRVNIIFTFTITCNNIEHIWFSGKAIKKIRYPW